MRSLLSVDLCLLSKPEKSLLVCLKKKSLSRKGSVGGCSGRGGAGGGGGGMKVCECEKVLKREAMCV